MWECVADGPVCAQFLVKKSYSEKRRRPVKRNWKLQVLDKDEEGLARRDGRDEDQRDKDLEQVRVHACANTWMHECADTRTLMWLHLGV